MPDVLCFNLPGFSGSHQWPSCRVGKRPGVLLLNRLSKRWSCLQPLPTSLPASPHCPCKSPLDTLLCKLGQASAFPLLTSDPVLGWFSRSFTTPSVSSLQNLTSVASLPFLFILVGLRLYDNHLAVILVGCEKEQKQVPVYNPLTLPGRPSVGS